MSRGDPAGTLGRRGPPQRRVTRRRALGLEISARCHPQPGPRERQTQQPGELLGQVELGAGLGAQAVIDAVGWSSSPEARRKASQGVQERRGVRAAGNRDQQAIATPKAAFSRSVRATIVRNAGGWDLKRARTPCRRGAPTPLDVDSAVRFGWISVCAALTGRIVVRARLAAEGKA